MWHLYIIVSYPLNNKPPLQLIINEKARKHSSERYFANKAAERAELHVLNQSEIRLRIMQLLTYGDTSRKVELNL